MSLDQKTVTHTATVQPRTTGPSKDAAGGFFLEKSQKVTVQNQPPAGLSNAEKRNHSTFWGPESQTDPMMPGKALSGYSTNSLIVYRDPWLQNSGCIVKEEC